MNTKNGIGMAVLLLALIFFVPSVTANAASIGLTAAMDKGVVSGELGVEIPGNVAVFHRGKIAPVPVDEEVDKSWQDVQLESSYKQRPQDLWSIMMGGEYILVNGPATADVSGLAAGEYVIFLWGCDIGSSTPQNCRWLEPQRFTVAQETECENQGYLCADLSSVQKLSPGDVKEHSYACREGRSCVEFTGESCGPGPSANIYIEEDPIESGKQTVIDAIAYDCDGSIASHSWNIYPFDSFSGGNPSAGETYTGDPIRHTFNSPGEYTVSLEVKDDEGNRAWDSQVVEVGRGQGQIPEDVILSGHRGAGSNGAGLAPENTIMAFETAREVGLNSVEFDVLPAKDGIAVIHDQNTERTTGESHKVAKTLLSTLTLLSADADYEVQDSEYAVSAADASDAKIPSLAETLDYFQGTDMIMRIEFKGKVKKDKSLGREVYEMVESRGMTDQAIFISFEGTCDVQLLTWDGGKRTCSYEGLEGVEEASNGAARTGVLWQRNKNPASSAWNSFVKYMPGDMLDEAEEQGFDIVVPRVSHTYTWAKWNVGLVSFDISMEEFIEDAESRGLDYAFMSSGKDAGVLLEEYGVEWVSTNRPDRLIKEVREYYEERDVDTR